MTIPEAKDIYQYYNCSPFRICTQNYHMYMEYHRLEVAKWQEEQWKNEKIQEMYVELTETGQVEIFLELYEIAEAFHDKEKLAVTYRSLGVVALPMKPKNMVELVETILGKRNRNVRSGMIYWAYDLQYVKVTGILFLYVQDCLEGIHTWDIYITRRIQKAKHLHKVMREELGY